jgi:septal ring factor EnvC (AmiA/AmiB activator)
MTAECTSHAPRAVESACFKKETRTTKQKKVAIFRGAASAAALAIALAIHPPSVSAQSEDAARKTQEAQTRQKLDVVRAEIKKISDAQKEINIQKSAAAAALREQELKIAATARELREIDQKIEAEQAKLQQLETQRGALETKLEGQRETLAALLRSAYAVGRHEELKLLLAQEDVAAIGRMLEYFHYFERARVAEIKTLLGDLDALARVHKDIEEATAQFNATREQRQGEAALLATERTQRQQALAEIEAKLKDEQTRLAALGKDEKALVDLLEKLRDIFADIPKQIAGAEPFASQRGRLNWPLRGRVAANFGARAGEHTSNGIVIAAAEGSEVHAASHGRVVFADWMRGFGLLMIVDHGDGYMSLYGHNETLLKEVGDWVDANEVIAASGATGGQKSSGVYFELRAQGKPIDPRAWLRP